MLLMAGAGLFRDRFVPACFLSGMQGKSFIPDDAFLQHGIGYNCHRREWIRMAVWYQVEKTEEGLQ